LALAALMPPARRPASPTLVATSAAEIDFDNDVVGIEVVMAFGHHLAPLRRAADRDPVRQDRKPSVIEQRPGVVNVFRSLRAFPAHGNRYIALQEHSHWRLSVSPKKRLFGESP
jgi:hypothetical protein